jgi:hypothetical protein
MQLEGFNRVNDQRSKINKVIATSITNIKINEFTD